MHLVSASTPVSGRYQPVELPPDDRGRRCWGIKDTTTDQLVDDEGEPIVFYTQRSADNWISRENYLSEAGMGRA